ncbi:MAG TPA: hypothetical protein VE954_25070 [Oligoflexus sp.]|uniref:hypothetical protein n=1 Tax=Oligoflexus sp. TaxID=1971216 RepID=UPI002D41DC80|nr:hypothetical protein [Oligoflexus sp.]HYX36391.1 hypothetical protein [Oligoflexus sp.]
MKMLKLALSIGLTTTALGSTAIARDFRDFPAIFGSERVSIPAGNITCVVLETSAPPGGFKGSKAQVQVSGFFINSAQQTLSIDADRPLSADLLTRNMRVARDCAEFLDDVSNGDVAAIRQGRKLQLVTNSYNVFDLD